MALFGKKKTEDDKVVKKTDDKAVKVNDAGKKPAAKKQSMKELYGGAKTSTKKTGDKAVKVNDVKNPEKSLRSLGAGKKPGRAYRVLVKPLITEKAANLGSENKYVFEVSMDANKIEVAKAVNEVYGVKPTAVNIIKVLGKRKRSGRKMGKRKDWKKAIVALPEGKTINIYEGV